MGATPASASDLSDKRYDVPTLAEMGYINIANEENRNNNNNAGPNNDTTPTAPFKGGETEALKRLQETVISKAAWVVAFEKPETSPNALSPSTTVLSPYLKFGCLSPTKFYHCLSAIYATQKTYSKPPVSLHGQLLWREFFYLQSYSTPAFDKMEGNSACKQIPWERDAEKIAAWKEGD